MFDHARWIWREGGAVPNSVSRFRTTFNIQKPLESCIIAVSAHNFFRFWVNGTEVGGICSPASSNFEKRKLYLTYNITELLHEGKNSLAFSVLFLGPNGQNRTCGCPALIFEAEARTGDQRFVISSGTDCRTSDISAYLPGLPLREKRGISGSTCYDESREEEGWRLPDFDDSDWDTAVLSPANLLVKELSPQVIPEGAILRTWTPELIHTEPGFRLYDAGEVFTGFIRVVLKGKKGDTIRLRYGEVLQGMRKTHSDYMEPHTPTAMRVEHGAVNDVTEYYLDDFVVQGKDSETWEEHFSYKAFRYFELSGIENCEIISVEACKTATNAPCVGEFSCDNDAVNAMMKACINTQQNNILGLLVDCPHREQAQYLGDSLMQSRQLCYNYPDAQDLLRKALQDFADTQLHAGDFPFIAPVDWEPYGRFKLKMPEYDLLFAEILWNLWQLYGDWDALERFYPTVCTTYGYYLSRRNTRGLLPRLNDGAIHISDWPYTNIDEEGDSLFVENVYCLMGLRRLTDIAALLCREEDMDYWADEYSRQFTNMRAAFYNADTGLFRSTPVSSQYHTGVNTLAFEAGLFTESERPAALQYLANAPYETRVILSWNYLKLLFENGYAQKAYDLITDPKVRWGMMIAEGSKTIWEGFEDIESHSHAWNCYPIRLLQEYIAGVHCTAPGFTEVKIAPFFPTGLNKISAKVYTPLGMIEVEGTREGTAAKFQVKIPSEMSAVFHFGNTDQDLTEGLTVINC